MHVRFLIDIHCIDRNEECECTSIHCFVRKAPVVIIFINGDKFTLRSGDEVEEDGDLISGGRLTGWLGGYYLLFMNRN